MADEKTPWEKLENLSELEEYILTKADTQDVVLLYMWTVFTQLGNAEYDAEIFKEIITKTFMLVRNEGQRSLIKRLEKAGFYDLKKEEQQAVMAMSYDDNIRTQINHLSRISQLGRLLKEKEDAGS